MPRNTLTGRLGRRGATLLALGVAFLFIGVKAILEPADDTGRFVLYSLLPFYARGIFWIVPALLAIGFAFRRDSRDAIGFSAVAVPPIGMAFSYLWSTVAYLAGATDYAFGWTSALTWALVGAFVLVVSGWPEPPPSTTRAGSRHRQTRR